MNGNRSSFSVLRSACEPEGRTSNVERGTANAERRTKNVERCGLGPAAVVALAATLLVAAVVQGAGQSGSSAARRAAPPESVRLYVFDCGTLEGADMGRYRLKNEEVATTRMSVACFLVAHPKGTLMWDVGAIPDAAWKPTGAPLAQRIVLPDSQTREVTMLKPLKTQLADVGYAPTSVNYLAMSHYHWDHTANANDFAGSTWLVRQVERDAMFSQKPTPLTQPSGYAALRTSKTVTIRNDEHDVFGDGTVLIKLAAGHTPGHQVLYVKLRKSGGVVLSGDLYHYPEERTLARVPTFEFNQEQTSATRAAIDAFLKKMGARLWIQHDFAADAKLKKAPSYYD
jgi:N-acyl homoserine lactone hydrolase